MTYENSGCGRIPDARKTRQASFNSRLIAHRDTQFYDVTALCIEALDAAPESMFSLKTSDYLGPFKILVLEPNRVMRRITVDILRLLGARRIVEVSDAEAAIPFIRQGDIDFIMSEWYLSSSCGVDLVRWIRQERGDIAFTPFIMMTSQTRLESVTAARNAGITEFVAKPFSAKSLIARVREVIERPRPFVSVGKYFGPDRRRRAVGVTDNENRRQAGTLLIGGENDLTQAQINNIISGSGRR